MAYQQDPDLEFLGQCSSEDLNDLVYLLTHGKDGNLRLTESLTNNEKYKSHYPDHAKYWQEIAEEIQCFGGNSIANTLRGGGVLYREILCDVCDKMKVKYNKNDSTERIEDSLLMKILKKSLEQMSEKEIRKLCEELQISNVQALSGAALTSAVLAVRSNGFLPYQYSVVIANAISQNLFKKGLRFVANKSLTKSISILAGPVGLAISGIWTAFDIASPATRVTFPAVIQIACLRRKFSQDKAQKGKFWLILLGIIALIYFLL